MPRQAVMLALVLGAVVLLSTDRGGTLLALPCKLAWAGLRLLGFRPRHLPALAATVLLVFQAAPTLGFRLPLALAVVGWLAWRFRPGRSNHSPRWLRRAERRYADALRDATRNLHGRNRKQATPKPTTPTRPVPPTPSPARPTTPTRRRPTTGRAPRRRAAARPRRARPVSPKPAAFWTPPPLGTEPVWPRWLRGGRRTNNGEETP
jgi:hypothetical protein